MITMLNKLMRTETLKDCARHAAYGTEIMPLPMAVNTIEKVHPTKP